MTIFAAGFKVGLVILAGTAVTGLLLMALFDFSPRGSSDWDAVTLVFLVSWLIVDGTYRLIRRLRRKGPPPAD
jgi:hypothetical protein